MYLEQALGTPAKIYYKDESVSPAGSHKPNTAIPQVWYNKKFGTKTITTETGAGQWGSALAFACSLLGLKCKVFMVRISFEQKPFRKIMMETWGGKCVASPSTETEAGRNFLKKDPNTPGSLGIAISEAVEAAVTDKSGTTKYSLGSVLNHVLLHQTIIGLEAKKQLAKIRDQETRRGHRVRRRRKQFCRYCVPVCRRQNQRRKYRNHPGGAGFLSVNDARHFHL